mmetsp:Transcript_51562/g.123561  ORF Transcript_51562/g.123561 Transcript_51562/m.123561 type:complete len:118 (+) Transcript_51562:97-450(+)
MAGGGGAQGVGFLAATADSDRLIDLWELVVLRTEGAGVARSRGALWWPSDCLPPFDRVDGGRIVRTWSMSRVGIVVYARPSPVDCPAARPELSAFSQGVGLFFGYASCRCFSLALGP